MRIRVRFFASIRERLGRQEAEFELAGGATVAGLWEAICRAHAELEPLGRTVTFAVNKEYVDRTHALADGDEVAVIPPVSGGVSMFRVVADRIDLSALVSAVADPAAGAVATFLGVTRNHNRGRRVIALEYEAYPEMAVGEMKRIGAAAREQWEIHAIAIAHRVGRVPVGEASVGIAVSASHREAAFEACRFAIDRLKEAVPIWKKEYFEGGEIWIGSPTENRVPPGRS